VDPAVSEWVVGDPTRLGQVLLNLVGNALKFTDTGEIVTTAELMEQRGDDMLVQFRVRDTGIGIANEHKARIFEAFVQADGSTTRNYGGTGLGLAICRNLSQHMGGELQLESEPGRGSTFYFAARLRRTASPVVCAPDEPVDLRGKRALIVDDNEVNRRILNDHLRRAGMETCTAESAFEAMRILAGHEAAQPFHVIITDVQMPGMDGFQFVEKLVVDGIARSSVIVMITSIDVVGSAARCRELGIVQYLVKPVSKKSLIQAVQNALQPHREKTLPASGAVENWPETPPLNILVAEDNVVNQKVAAGLLEKRGHRVTVVPNGATALEAFRRERFDVILMDVQMPVLDGLSATTGIREWETAHGLPRTPVIALTSYAFKGDQERCLAAGMDDYVAKPFKPQELWAALSRATAVEVS
jgi:CheY-like chemotaxis protein